ncbi:thrombospondin type-1 domain-containing 1 [Pelobates cultripes]|uniref:Thrombospondin type-1 domain-containing 1 n=1 Tax=Pelobates cultripes TaxID=61616 RepID=A0AAD1RH46_PELCU|nr:thrombospondin type-1 domain-containing 1 [Pelobates cultripes]
MWHMGGRCNRKMRQTLHSFITMSLVLFWDSVFSDPGYLLLRKSHHIALSRDPVFVDFFLPDNDTITSSNISIFLLNTGNNHKITSKELPANTTQGSLVFECFYFIQNGLYQFQMSLQKENSTHICGSSSILNVTWPLFHIDLNRTSKDNVRSFQIGIFTNELLCSIYTDKEPAMLLEVEHTHSFQELEEPSSDRFMLYKTYKEIPLSSTQWVEFECASVRSETFITVSLKPMDSQYDSVIAFLGPIDLVKTFKYKLVTSPDEKCDGSMKIYVIPPPCNYVEGNLAVYKKAPRHLSESLPVIAEHVMRTGDKMAIFNCSLFDIGRNTYCFELLMRSSNSYSFPKINECVEIRREIETWSLWQSWSPCSTTCGDGQRQRHRECLSTSLLNPSCNGSPKEISICSLEDCSTIKPPIKSTKNSNGDSKTTSNTVTITGISLCLFIIIITIVITVWRKLSKAQTCSSTVRHNSNHSVSCRKNSDEENIYQLRESFSDTGEILMDSTDDAVHIPLNYRQSSPVSQEQAIKEIDDSPNVQKIIPPIFSYRLAQQQLKEMRQKGLSEATKVYHVSQNPTADTAVDMSLNPPPINDNSDETNTNKFRIQSPFLVPKNTHGRDERPNSKSVFSPSHGVTPSQTLPRLSHLKNQDTKSRHYERGGQKNNFRRTSSFHDTKHNKPYRERSLTTLSPRHSMSYNAKTKTWECSTVERSKYKPTRTDKSNDNITRGTNFKDSTGYLTKSSYVRPMGSKPDLICSRQLSARTSNAERPEQNRPRKGPSPVNTTWNRVHRDLSSSPKDSYNKNSSLISVQNRKEKCQSFPWGTEYSFYDNSTFGLTEAEQQMIDLPGYFASNEEDETSTLSVERLKFVHRGSLQSSPQC